MEKNIPNDHEIYQMATKIPNGHKIGPTVIKIPTSSIARTYKIYPNKYFWF
jgi:hypothetical protein